MRSGLVNASLVGWLGSALVWWDWRLGLWLDGKFWDRRSGRGRGRGRGGCRLRNRAPEWCTLTVVGSESSAQAVGGHTLSSGTVGERASGGSERQCVAAACGTAGKLEVRPASAVGGTNTSGQDGQWPGPRMGHVGGCWGVQLLLRAQRQGNTRQRWAGAGHVRQDRAPMLEIGLWDLEPARMFWAGCLVGDSLNCCRA